MKKYYLLIILTIVSFGTFAQLKKFTVEVPVKPKMNISDSIQGFLIMNRAMTPDFNNFDEDSLQIAFYKQNFNVNAVLLDSIVADTTIKILGEMLYESGRYDIVIPVERNIYRLLPYGETPEPLTWNYVETLCSQFGTDALIVLENIAMRTVTSYQSQKEYYGYSYEKTYFASIDFYYRAHWRIYDPLNKKIIVDYVTNKDTLYWDSYEADLLTCFANLPTIKEACIETGIKSAIDLNEIISPKWETETRYYYVVNDDSIDLSIEYAAQGKWEAARDNWQKYIDEGNSIKRSKTMFNLALALEMTGDLPGAVKWLRNSNKIYYRDITGNYLKQLLERYSKQN
ncbi:MAG: tetratricopeptide repeat protein [Prolixibacteraceae bacterium]|nr:tetratricopeptide repeat protein [Prolixibacteraceae bacterium]